jgi:hypothetical protein
MTLTPAAANGALCRGGSYESFMRRRSDWDRVLIAPRSISPLHPKESPPGEPIRMTDLFYLALGVVSLLVFAAYAYGLSRV